MALEDQIAALKEQVAADEQLVGRLQRVVQNRTIDGVDAGLATELLRQNQLALAQRRAKRLRAADQRQAQT